MPAVSSPFPQYFDIPSGDPLDSGALYFGVVNLDPTTNPIAVYWDAAYTVPAAQPIPTISGYPARAGTPALIFAPGDYSLAVRNRKGIQVYYAPDSSQYTLGSSIAGITTTLASASGADGIGRKYPLSSSFANTVGAWINWQAINAFEFMTPAQIADVQAGTLLLDVTAALQAWATACAGKHGYAPWGKYMHTAAIVYPGNAKFTGDGGHSTQFYTALDIEQANNVPGAFSTKFSGIGWYNTFPVSTVPGPSFTGTTTSGQTTITAVSSIVGLYKGMQISGAGVPANSYIRKFTNDTLYLCDSTGAAVNATANGTSIAFATNFRQGQTHFHAHMTNAGDFCFDSCYFKSNFTDADFSPNNHAGIWFDRDGPSTNSYINIVQGGTWVDHGQVLMGTSDSNVRGCTIWGNTFDFALKLSAPNIGVVGNNISAGSRAGIWAAASATEPNGATDHSIDANNIDGGDIYYTGYGVQLDKPIGVNIGSGNRINDCYKGGVYLTDGTAVKIDPMFFNNNRDGLGYSDIENVGVSQQPVAVSAIGATFFQSGYQTPTQGYAIKEVNSGFYPANCAYQGNTISGNFYAGPNAILVVTPVGSGQYPKISGNTGGGSETESLPNAATNSATLTLTGCTTAPTATTTWTRQGNLVTMTLPALSATSNTTACALTGLPAGIWPVTSQGLMFAVIDNGSTSYGYITVGSDGSLTLSKLAGAFTNSGTKGSFGGVVTYQLVS